MSAAGMPVVYIAGPYRGRTRAAVELNIQSARALGLLAARKGWSPIIPHANTGHLDLVAPDLQDRFWLEATLELMRRSDAVLLCPGWENSEGTQAEVAEATRTGIPVIHSLHALPCADDWRQLEQIEIQAQPVGRAHGKECSATPAREA